MPALIGLNPDGTYKVQTDSGAVLDTTFSALPPYLQAEAAAANSSVDAASPVPPAPSPAAPVDDGGIGRDALKATGGLLMGPLGIALGTANFAANPALRETVGNATDSAARALGRGARAVGHAVAPNLVSPMPAAVPTAAPGQPPPANPAPGAPAPGPSSGPLGAAQGAAMGAGAGEPGTSVRAFSRDFGPVSMGTPGMAALREGFAQERRAYAEHAAAEKGRLDATAAFQEEQAQRAQAEAVSEAEWRQQEAQRADALISDYRAATKESEEYAQKVDPARWWNSRTDAQRVFALISAFFAGFAGTTSPIEKAIDRDIALQQKEIEGERERRRQKVGDIGNLLALNRQRFQDSVLAREATRGMQWKAVELQGSALATRLSAPEAQARGRLLAATAQQKQAEAEDAMRARSLQLSMQARSLQLQQAETMAKLGGAAGGVDPALVVPGLGLALDKEAAKKARDAKSAYDGVQSLLSRLIAWREGYGSETLNRAALKEGNSIATQLRLAIKDAANLGALDKGSLEVMTQLVPEDAGAVGYLLPGLKALQTGLDEKFRANVQSYMNPRATFAPSTLRRE